VDTSQEGRLQEGTTQPILKEKRSCEVKCDENHDRKLLPATVSEDNNTNTRINTITSRKNTEIIDDKSINKRLIQKYLETSTAFLARRILYENE
jgi:hypothetical protein